MPQGYLIKLMKDGKALAHRRVEPEVQELDLAELLPAKDDGHDYTATVQALGDGTRWRDSLPSETSDPWEAQGITRIISTSAWYHKPTKMISGSAILGGGEE